MQVGKNYAEIILNSTGKGRHQVYISGETDERVIRDGLFFDNKEVARKYVNELKKRIEKRLL